jgi:hypothetical protein
MCTLTFFFTLMHGVPGISPPLQFRPPGGGAFLTVAWDNYYMGWVIWNQYQFKIVKTELEITADHRSMIGKKLLMIGGGKAGFPTWKKQGKSRLPITMIENFGNVISTPVRIRIYNYMLERACSKSIKLMTLHNTPYIFCIFSHQC